MYNCIITTVLVDWLIGFCSLPSQRYSSTWDFRLKGGWIEDTGRWFYNLFLKDTRPGGRRCVAIWSAAAFGERLFATRRILWAIWPDLPGSVGKSTCWIASLKRAEHALSCCFKLRKMNSFASQRQLLVDKSNVKGSEFEEERKGTWTNDD